MELDSNDSVRRVLWPVKTEAASVIAEMRQNAKWATNRPAVRSALHLNRIEFHIPFLSVYSRIGAQRLCEHSCCLQARHVMLQKQGRDCMQMLYNQDPAWALLYNLQQLRMSHHSTLRTFRPLLPHEQAIPTCK